MLVRAKILGNRLKEEYYMFKYKYLKYYSIYTYIIGTDTIYICGELNNKSIIMPIRITCINKASGDHENPYIAISNLDWTNESSGNCGKITRLDLSYWIKDERGKAYVKDSKGNIAYLTAELSPKGTKYVKTRPDDTKTDNLLSLPECI